MTACGRPAENQGFAIRDAVIEWRAGALQVRIDQDLQLSPEAVEALQHGVPLTLKLALELRNADTLNLVREHNRQYIIRYLPLSRHYELDPAGSGPRRSFPRLRHVLAALNNEVTSLRGLQLGTGNYLVRSRIHLDLWALPGPMQLPAMLSRRWTHDSEWTNWPFSVKA